MNADSYRLSQSRAAETAPIAELRRAVARPRPATRPYRTSTAPAHGGLPGAVSAAMASTVLARSSRSGSIRFRYAGESQSLSRRRARADAEEGVPARFRIHAIPETDMHDPERDIRDIPLSQLELSPDNVRKTPADDSAFTELKASIAAHGLLENLIAHAMGLGADGIGRYAVIAGGRRLAAMQALAAEGTLDEDHPVPCRMIGDIVTAEEVSLAENSVRAAMHPADQVEAFRRLADAGSTAAAIAARFGVSERTVEKRLRLGNAAPVLLEAYRAGEIDLDTLMAFAVTTNQARQSAVWETVSQQGYRPGAWQIKRLLTEDRVPATSAIVRFVGIEAYEATGGKIDRDLFAEEDERGIWFDDPDLLNKLAMDSLQAAIRELETRWKWAEARLDVDWSATAAFGRVRPQPAEPTDEEKVEIERLSTRNGELANMDDDGWTEELVEEADSSETRLDEIEATIEARAIYRREDIAIAGCIATVGNDGELKLIQGLVRPEDMPARESGEAGAAGHDDILDTDPAIQRGREDTPEDSQQAQVQSASPQTPEERARQAQEDAREFSRLQSAAYNATGEARKAAQKAFDDYRRAACPCTSRTRTLLGWRSCSPRPRCPCASTAGPRPAAGYCGAACDGTCRPPRAKDRRDWPAPRSPHRPGDRPSAEERCTGWRSPNRGAR